MSTPARQKPAATDPGEIQQPDHFAALVDSSEDAILSKDPNGVITSWNPAAQRLYGYSPEEAIGQPITLIIPADRKGEEQEILTSILAGERIEHYETERVRKDGRRVHVSLTVSPIRVGGGKIVGASVVARDIGELVAVRKRATTLHEITTTLTREAEPERAIGVLLKDGTEALGADAATAGILDESGENIVLAGAVGYSEEGLYGWRRFPLADELPMSVAIRNAEPVFSTSEQDLIERFPPLAGSEVRFAALAVLPIVVDDEPMGAVAFSFREPRQFTDEERAFMVAIVQQAAYTLGRASLFEAERLRRQQLSFLARASELLGESLDADQTLYRLAFLIVPEIADWCAIDLVEPAGELRRVATAHADPDKVKLVEQLEERYPPDPDAPRGAPNVIRSREAELYPTITEELLVEGAQSDEHLELLRELRMSSAMVLPMLARGRTLGAITIVAAESGRTYGEEDLVVARDLARRAAMAVDTSVLYQREHETALTLQRALLPAKLPEVKGVRLAARYMPAEAGMEIGGDWYDVIEPSSGCVGLVIGDVAGRGVEAAAVMGRLTMALRAYVADGRDPHESVTGLDQLMKTLAQAQMATLFHLNLDLTSHTAEFVRAGHPPALLRRTDGEIVELYGQGSPPLGLVEGAEFGSAEVQVPPGSLLLLYTDGLIERRGQDLNESLERLKLALATAPGDPAAIVNELPAALDAENIPDDIAMLVLRVDD